MGEPQEKSARPSWDEYFMQLAQAAASRSTCTRKQVGCVLVVDRSVVATGYVGSMLGQPHCLDVGCEIGPDGGCIRTVHAELNAIAQAAKRGVAIEGAAAYITMSPCAACFKALVNAGVTDIVYQEPYRIPLDPALVASPYVLVRRIVA